MERTCCIFGAGDYGAMPRPELDGRCFLIAADGGYGQLKQWGMSPHLAVGDFDSLGRVPEAVEVVRHPVRKDDTDMMLAIKKGLERGCREFHLYGGTGGRRSDHTVANYQALLYLARRGARGWLYGNGEIYTAVCGKGEITFPARADGILSVFCLGELAAGVTIRGAHYSVENAVLTPDFPLGCSNHFIGRPITVSVERGDLLLGLHEVEE